jgi:hypothetical protein
MIDNRDIATALGKKLWTTDLFMPQYRTGEIGPWRINPGGQLVTDWGYYTGQCLVEMLPSLVRKVKSRENVDGDFWEIWMSLTPHEIESQEFGCRHAFKHTAIMGLGMGWVAANIAMNPLVTKVTVVELDPAVIELFEHSGALESLPESARRKINIVNANAIDWRPAAAEPVNFLYVDIWRRLAEPAALNQVRQMQANIQAEKIYYWGQEIAINCAAKRFVPDGSKITAEAVQRAVKEVMQIPLLVPKDCGYLQIIKQVIQNRIKRRLTVKVDCT